MNDLEGMLAEIRTSYGIVHIHSHDDGTWSCQCSILTPVKGAEVKVHSGFTHRSPLAAVSTTLARCRALTLAPTKGELHA